MSIILRICLILGVIAFFAIILIFLRKKSINLNYSLLWLLFGTVLLIVGLFPQIVTFVSKLLGIQSPSNTVFAIMLFLILVILIALTAIVSKQHRKIKCLVQNLALVQKQLNDMKKVNYD